MQYQETGDEGVTPPIEVKLPGFNSADSSITDGASGKSTSTDTQSEQDKEGMD